MDAVDSDGIIEWRRASSFVVRHKQGKEEARSSGRESAANAVATRFELAKRCLAASLAVPGPRSPTAWYDPECFGLLFASHRTRTLFTSSPSTQDERSSASHPPLASQSALSRSYRFDDPLKATNKVNLKLYLNESYRKSMSRPASNSLTPWSTR